MKADERKRKMLEKDARNNTYKLYKSGKKLFIRLRGKERYSLKKHRVLTGRILKRYKDDATFLMKVKIPGEAEPSVLIIPDCLDKVNQSKQKNKRLPKFFS